MGGFLSVPILLIAAVLQASLIPRLDLPGGGPNLTYVCVLAWSLNAPVAQAAIWAFLGGLFHDILSAVPLGTSSLGLVLLIYFISGLGTQVYRLGLLLLIFMSVFGTLAFEFGRVVLIDLFHLIGFIYSTTPVQITWGADLTTTVFPTMVYNFVLVLPVYMLLRVLQRRLPRTE
jgi:rod shape-determining protein MreD